MKHVLAFLLFATACHAPSAAPSDASLDTDDVVPTYADPPSPTITLDAACGVVVKQRCDPLDATGCTAGETCDLAADGTWQCLPAGEAVGVGATCDGLVGPWCGTGLSCVGSATSGSTCAKLCCGEDACGEGERCAPLHAVGDSQGAVGACVATAAAAAVIGNHPANVEGRGHVVTWTSWKDALAREMAWYADVCDDVGGYPLLASATHYGADCDPGDSREVIIALQDGTAILSDLKYDEYTGKTDPRWLADARRFGDYIVDEGLTPDDGLYPRVPRSTGIPRTFPQPPDCGIRSDGPYEIEPDKVGLAGYALVKLSDATGDRRYGDAALHFANVLAATMVDGDATRAPWPFRVDWRDGTSATPASGNQSYNLRLFDALIDAGHDELKPARDRLWAWMRDVQIPNAAGDGLLWAQFFEDQIGPGNRTAWSPLATASYLMERRDKLDRHWREHVETLLDFVEATFVDPHQGFDVCIEQDIDRKPYGGVLSTYGVAEAQYAALTGDPGRRARAYQAFALLVQAIGDDGCTNDQALEAGCGGWQEDAHTDKVHNVLDALALFPAWGE